MAGNCGLKRQQGMFAAVRAMPPAWEAYRCGLHTTVLNLIGGRDGIGSLDEDELRLAAVGSHGLRHCVDGFASQGRLQMRAAGCDPDYSYPLQTLEGGDFMCG